MPEASATGIAPPRLAGWVGLDAPLELLEAAGLTPWRLTADPRSGPAQGAEPYGEGGGHPWMRALLAAMRDGPELERLVLCSTPANELWLYNLLLSLGLRGEAGAFPPADLCNLSHEARPSSQRLNHSALQTLARSLGAADRAALAAAIADRNRLRAALRSIDARRHGTGGRIAGLEARRRMDLADRMRSVEALEALRSAKDPPPAPGLPVILSSPIVPCLDLYAALEARGLRVVADDADAGTRAIGPDTAEHVEPLEALARRYAARSPAPAGWTTSQRIAYLTDLALSRQARAVVFDLPPWNHPSGWDYPLVRQALQDRGVLCVELPYAAPDTAAQAVAETLAAPIAEFADA